ncbi:DUF3108 domain-containing protein [bacterium]|nr:DUF3108 domain-containing protein [bacterium]
MTLRRLSAPGVMSRLLLAAVLFCSLPQAQAQSRGAVWKTGERLSYRVTWSLFRLGTLTLHVADSLTTGEGPAYRIDMAIDSNPLLFFINRHYRYSCTIGDDFRVRNLEYLDEEEGKIYRAAYAFDHAAHSVSLVMTDTSDTSRVIRKTVFYENRLYDGLSLIYYVRQHLEETRIDTVQYIADDGYADMVIDYRGEGDPVRVRALAGATATWEIAGMVYDKGIAGLSGPFRGWFSRDARRLPLKAALKVFIGSVWVELEEIAYE